MSKLCGLKALLILDIMKQLIVTINKLLIFKLLRRIGFSILLVLDITQLKDHLQTYQVAPMFLLILVYKVSLFHLMPIIIFRMIFKYFIMVTGNVVFKLGDFVCLLSLVALIFNLVLTMIILQIMYLLYGLVQVTQ